MPGLVGYTFSKDLKKRKPLKSMISTMGNFAVDEFYGHSLHIARVHPAIFNKGAQPVWNENKMLGIMFYGKIYGYEQEMKKLREQEHKIEAGSDAEFVIHAYEEFGNEAFTKLNGS